MPLVTTKEMFKKSMEEKFAIGAFNVNNMEIIQGIVDAAAEEKSPVILQCSSGAIKYARIPYLRKMIELSPPTSFIFVVSPVWYDFDTSHLLPVKTMCKEKGIQFIDYSNHPKFNFNNDFFMDGVHLNAKGADEFSRDLAHELKVRHIIE